MLPSFLIPEAIIREDGEGPVIGLGSSKGKLLLLTLGITRIIEQESLEISIWGSADQQDWGARPIVVFPQKFYCGTYQLLLDLSEHPEVQYLKAKCKVARWGRGEPKPLFGAYLFAQETEPRAVAGVA
ncbi:MAG: hypothetical protein ACM336_07720 [Acidobacteriota bacterium]